MTALVLPSDRGGCGYFRLGWAAQELKKCGADLRIEWPDQRQSIKAGFNADGHVIQTWLPDDIDRIITQRLTHRYILESIPLWQEQGIKVVIDLDDDLSCIHPSHGAFSMWRQPDQNLHSWQNLQKACRQADRVVVTTAALAKRYRPDARIVPNYLPDHYFGRERVDGTDLTWPASLESHPNDSAAIGRTLARVVRETGVKVIAPGYTPAVVESYQLAFGVEEVSWIEEVDLKDWPALLSGIGVAFVPLANTKFNEAKSWLKVLELSACGVPWVASPRADYLRFAQISGVGRFAETPNQWRSELKHLIQDDAWRKENSEVNRAAAEQFRLSDHLHRFAEAWGLI